MTVTTRNGESLRRGRRTLRTALGATLAGLLVLSVGCTGAATESSSGGAAPAAAPQDLAATSGEAGDAGARSNAAADEAKAGADQPGAASVALVPRDLVVTGSLTVRVKDVTNAAARTRALATQLGGMVASERVTGGSEVEKPDAPSARGEDTSGGPWPSAQLTLRVPTDRANEAMDRVADLGTLLERDLSSEDVTAQVVDVESRVATARASVERVRALLDQAKTLGEVVQIESELTRRQSDLESLEAQRKRLANLTDLATVTVTLVPKAAAVVVASERGGFLSGLRAGWTAFVAAADAGLTALGALLPFVALAALVGVPVMVVLRRRSRRVPDQTRAS